MDEGSSSRNANEPSTNGLSIIADPENPTLDIVFVHGFKGHPVRTWSHKTEYVIQNRGVSSADDCHRPAKIPRLTAVKSLLGEKEDRKYVYWPRDLIPQTLPKARVLVYGYDTNIRHALGAPVSKNTVYDIAYDFLQSLEAARRSQPTRPLVFVAHSLGGIVVKEALRRSYGFANHHAYLHQIYESTAAILFFGTPHGGADPRGLLQSIAEKAIRAAGFTVNEEVVKSLLPTSERLRELRDEFAPMAHQNKWIIYSFQEQYGVQLLQGKKVVEDVSSCLGDSLLEMTQHIANNHMDMCRFGGLDDVEYRKVVAAVDRVHMQITEASVDSVSPDMNLIPIDNHRQYYMDSLWYPAVESRHATIKTAHAKTCKWFVEKSEYRDWLDVDKTTNHHGFLWIRGKPGSGKSTLMKFAVANMRRVMKETIVISCFFNARGEDLEKSTLGMYRSLLFQILKAVSDLQKILDPLGSSVPQGESYAWKEDNLQTLFSAAIGGLGQRHLTCFIDALDECDETQIRDLVAFLERLGQDAVSSQINFRVCLSSRHYPHVSIRNGIEMTLQDQEGHSQDIAKYLNSELKVGNGAQSKTIKEEILERSSGIFLWVALVVQILNKEYDHGRIHSLRRRLKDIPDGLDKLFEEILMRDQENKEELLLCLRLILYARRPLKREEVYHAILHGTNPGALAESNPEDITAEDMERFILSCSKGLAETTKLKAQTVQFIHESVRDFLLGKTGLNKLKLELEIGLSQNCLKECCHKYLVAVETAKYPLYPEQPPASSEEAKLIRQSANEDSPFLDYAVRNVLYHADVAAGQGISQQAFLREFALDHWILLNNVLEKYEIRRYTPKASLLYLIAARNLSSLVRTQLEQDVGQGFVEALFGIERYSCPLHAALAIENANEDMIQALLISHTGSKGMSDESRAAARTLVKSGKSLRSSDYQNMTSWAAREGNVDLIRFLLTKTNVNPEVKDKKGQTPLSVAAENGHDKVMSLLLTQAPKAVDLEYADEGNYTLLSRAVLNGHVGVVRVLLLQDVNLEAKDYGGETPLSRAASFEKEEIARLLLTRKDINPNAKSAHGYTPLVLAARNGNEKIVRSLLTRADIDPNAKDEYGDTPLIRAARRGNEEIVRLLLAHEKTDPNFKRWNGATALANAALCGREAVVRLLLTKKDVDIGNVDLYLRTAYTIAVDQRHHAVAELIARAIRSDNLSQQQSNPSDT